MSQIDPTLQRGKLHNAVSMQRHSAVIPRVRLSVLGSVLTLFVASGAFGAIDVHQVGAGDDAPDSSRTTCAQVRK